MFFLICFAKFGNFASKDGSTWNKNFNGIFWEYSPCESYSVRQMPQIHFNIGSFSNYYPEKKKD